MLKEVEAPIPEAFVHEYIDGMPMYMKGYRELDGDAERVEEIKGVGGIHALIATIFSFFLHKNISDEKYWLFGGRPGLEMNAENIFCIDMMLVDKQKLPGSAIGYGFVNVPPQLTFEVDVSCENDDITEMEYILKKTQLLLYFGTQQIIWIFSRSQKIMVAQPDAPWRIINWADDIVLIDGVVFNLDNHVRAGGLYSLMKLS